jgi:tripartite-type tricarboxylate transporter receptor subunit TctC
MLPSATRAWTLAWTLALVPALAAAFSATPASAADYYAGKTIELLVGAPPGGGYDIYARAVARHFGRHIPGTPTIVVKNMPGAGSAKAAQYIQSIAPKDGTALAGVMPGAIMGPLLDDRTSPMFDPTKIRYVGTANSGTRVCATLKGSKIGSFADAQKV